MEEMPVVLEEATETEGPPPSKSFASCSDVEVVQLGTGRLSTHTQEQTRWAVATFKGIDHFQSATLPTILCAAVML